MALEPTRIAVDFVRQTRTGAGAPIGSPRSVLAVPTTGRLTKAAERGYFDLPPSVAAVYTDPAAGTGVLLLAATVEHDSPWGWRIKVDGQDWRVVTVPTAPTPTRTLTVAGTSYPAAYLTSLAAFAG